MQTNVSAGNFQPKFTSVVPVRVFIDGMETFAESSVKTAGRQLTNILAGPVRGDVKKLQIAKRLAALDPDYDLSAAIAGYNSGDARKKTTPSDFFRLIRGQSGKFYLFTGAQAERLLCLGKAVGNEKYISKQNNCLNSLDLYVAKRNYEDYIRKTINNVKLRITEFYDKAAGKKLGKPVELNILMTSNQKYGKSTFKMNLSDVIFQ